MGMKYLQVEAACGPVRSEVGDSVLRSAATLSSTFIRFFFLSCTLATTAAPSNCLFFPSFTVWVIFTSFPFFPFLFTFAAACA